MHILAVADLNVPWAKAKKHLSELCSAIQFTNDLNPCKHAALIELPEIAKKTSKRGLCDEETEVQNECWSLRQVCDSRWMCPFDVHPSAEHQTGRKSLCLLISLPCCASPQFVFLSLARGHDTFFVGFAQLSLRSSQFRLDSRRFNQGRFVTNKEGAETNAWTNFSELGVCGRPLGDQKIFMPLSKDLLLPESLSAEEDLRFAERQRPSPETVAAQKGKDRWMTLLRSALTMVGNYDMTNTPVIILNFTSYVEDVGTAATWHTLENILGTLANICLKGGGACGVLNVRPGSK